MKRSTTIFLAGLLLTATYAHAQVKQGTQQAGVSIGLANPVSNNTVDGETEVFGVPGPAFGANYLYQIHSHLGLGADFSYKDLGTESVTTRHGPVDINSSIWTLLAIARADLIPQSNIRPYGLLGLGIGGATSQGNYSENPYVNFSRTASGVAFAMGAGLDYDISSALFTGAELRYNILSTSDDAIGTSSVRTLDVLFKVGCKF